MRSQSEENQIKLTLNVHINSVLGHAGSNSVRQFTVISSDISTSRIFHQQRSLFRVAAIISRLIQIQWDPILQPLHRVQRIWICLVLTEYQKVVCLVHCNVIRFHRHNWGVWQSGKMERCEFLLF